MSTYTELLSDIITAGGGNVDNLPDKLPSTLLNAIGGIVGSISNPNLLINPDLSINQRGQTEYTQRNAYTVDGWKLHASDGVVFNAETKTITIPQNDVAAWYGIVQPIEYNLAGKTVTMSAKVETDVDIYARITWGNSTNKDFLQLIPAGFSGIVVLTADIPEIGNSFNVQFTNKYNPTAGGTCKVDWTKLEIGNVATPYIPPDPATELTRCQRYYQIHTTGDIDPVDLRPPMATITDIKERSDGKYEYIAGL